MDMNDILDFLRELRAHNDREWFNANKERYLKVKERVDGLAAELITLVSEVDAEASRLTPADCTYRIYRDTRFSTDKSPYKTHVGIFVNPPFGKKSLRCGYYLHIEPDNCFFAAGTVCLPSPLVKAIRQSIYDEIDEYRSIVESDGFRCVFPRIGENLLKTAPKGFPKDWPYMDYIRPKDFCCSTDIFSDDSLSRDDFPRNLLPIIRQAGRFNDFINYSIDEFNETH
ncbi:DUF2461 domain-containing protein [uncultured Muribaculum sp.]|uniref:DUF2461 domain-containing protein n=1 Tax=uncultured Muribaculum sp. TaxID=1918613 RepID=UPI0025EC7A8F|nr:DUF2461 domain-containing protein [uncultured Muribaculum sp.]